MNAPVEIIKRERPLIEPGWYRDLSNEEYHGSFGYSSSQIKTLIEQTPAHLRHSFTVQKETTVNMLLGTAVHTLVLEPEKFAAEFAISQKFDGRTNAGKAAKALFELESAGRTVITEDVAEKAQAMAAAILNHPIASLLVKDIVTESSVYWWYKSMDADDDTRYKIMTKVRPDILCRNYPVIADIKSTADGSYSGFIKSIQNFYYHVSAAMYLEGVNQCKPLLEEMRHFAYNKFVFICVENFEPYLVSCYELHADYLEIGKFLYRYAMRKLRDGQENDWPGYPDEIRVIEPPPWASRGFVV
jgi:hypothetical protein